MKFPKFYDVLDETVVEVDTDFYTTVERLRSMQGACRETDGNQFPLEFLCSKKGRLHVQKFHNRYSYSHNRYSSSIGWRLNFVVGEVVEQDGKTAVKIYSVHDRSVKVFRYVHFGIVFVLFCVFLATLAFSVKQGIPLMRKEILSVAGIALVLLLIPFSTKTETQNQTDDLQIMKNELLNRIRAVERWDD